MKLPHFSKDTKELGIAWFLVPLLGIFAALVAYYALSIQSTLLADSLSAHGGAVTNAMSFAPPSGSDSPVPDAATVFKDRPHEVSEHIDTF